MPVDLASGGYATPEDLAVWVDDEDMPGNPPRYLRSASLLVAQACARNPYTDTPSDSDAAGLRDATCAQVAAWVATGIDPGKLGPGGPAPVKKAQILTGDVEYDTTAQAKALATVTGGELAPEATAILSAAGLLYVPLPLGTDPAALWLPSYGLDCPPPFDDCLPAFGATPLPHDTSTQVLAGLNNIQETLMAFTPAANDVTRISGAVITIASSTTSAALTLGRAHLITGSAVQPLTVPTPTVDNTRIEIKVADGSTASATLPAALQLSGVTTMTAGQDYGFFWSSASSAWSID